MKHSRQPIDLVVRKRRPPGADNGARQLGLSLCRLGQNPQVAGKPGDNL